MSLDPAINFSRVDVLLAYSDSATAIDVAPGQGVLVPFPANGVWWSGANNPGDDPNVEIVRCVNVVGDTLTVQRAGEDGVRHPATAKSPASVVIFGPTAALITQLQSELDLKATAGDIATAINALVNAAPGTLDTLAEIATQLQSDEGALVISLAGKAPLSHVSDTANPHSVTKAQVGLGSVDNTSDAGKNSAIATLTNKTIDGGTY